MKPFLTFGAPDIGDAEVAEVVDSLRSGWIGTGPKVAQFERMLEEYLGARHVRAVSSCTAALILGMKTLGVGPGDEVIVPAMTFVASANAIEHTGAKPVFVDSKDLTGLIDLQAAERAITNRTKAIMPVHLSGRPVDPRSLYTLCQQHKLEVIEDAAHALGAESNGQRIGGHGVTAAFSFYVTKNITTIEGGAVATDNPDIAEAVERLALHGLSTGAWQRYSDAGFRHYEVTEPGFKFNMTDIQAALGIHQLPRLDRWIEERAKRWANYDRMLGDLPVVTPPAAEPDTRHARHLYQVLVEDEAGVSRDTLMEILRRAGIGSGVHYRGVHLHPYYRDKYALDPERFPIATYISERTLSLPLSPAMTETDQERVAKAMRSGLKDGPNSPYLAAPRSQQ